MILAICFLGSEYFAQRFSQHFHKAPQKIFRVFLYPKKNVFDQKWGYMWKLVGVFGSNVPQAVLIDPWAFHVDVLKGKKCAQKNQGTFGQNWAKIGPNPLYT